jgi:hypothetical protein
MKDETNQEWHLVTHHELHDTAKASTLCKIDKVFERKGEIYMRVELDADCVFRQLVLILFVIIVVVVVGFAFLGCLFSFL